MSRRVSGVYVEDPQGSETHTSQRIIVRCGAPMQAFHAWGTLCQRLVILVTLEAQKANNSEAPSANEWPDIHIRSIVRDMLGIIYYLINYDLIAFLIAKYLSMW